MKRVIDVVPESDLEAAQRRKRESDEAIAEGRPTLKTNVLGVKLAQSLLAKSVKKKGA